MTMSDRQPIPHFGPVNPEEYLDQFDAYTALHELYNWAINEDEAVEERRMSHLDSAARLETQHYLLLGVAGDVDSPMTCNYQQMVLRPYSGTIAKAKVFEIVARFPHFTKQQQPVDLPVNATRWNDVSLEVAFSDNTCYRYWLNGKGLIPYKDADSVDITFPRDSDETDLFTVLSNGIDPDARPFTGGELKMILKSCEIKLQPNNPEDE